MLHEFVEWLKQLSIFMILCESILSFAPTQTYRRYIKPFVGMILLFRIVVFLIGAGEVNWDERVEEVLNRYENSISSYLEKEAIVEEDFEEEILNEDIINVSEITIDRIRIGESE